MRCIKAKRLVISTCHSALILFNKILKNSTSINCWIVSRSISIGADISVSRYCRRACLSRTGACSRSISTGCNGMAPVMAAPSLQLWQCASGNAFTATSSIMTDAANSWLEITSPPKLPGRMLSP